MPVQQADEITVAEAAIRLRISRERVIRLIQVGRLAGRRDPTDGWVASQAAVTAVANTPAGKA